MRVAALIRSVVIVWSLGTCVLAAGTDHAALRHEAVQSLDRLKALAARAEERGIDTARERVTIVTAEMFLRFADWDARHPAKLRNALGAWWRMQDRSEELSRELPGKELRDVKLIVDAAIREAVVVLGRPASRRTVPVVDHSALEIIDGYFHFNGRPTFPSTFVWMPRDVDLIEAYGDVNDAYIAPSRKKSLDGRTVISFQPEEHESMGRVFFGHDRMPKWARQAYPGIEVGRRHFTAYDIDHPGTREVWQALLKDTVPRFAGRKVSQAGYLLANEPHWFSATGEWDTGSVSDFTMAKFRIWLAERHGKVAALNRLWGTDFASFEDVALAIPIAADLRGTPIWYDWCRFNMHRVSDWFSFLRSEVRTHDAAAKVHIKLIPEHLTRGARSHGLDFETLVRLQEIIGCDATTTNAPTWMENVDDWSDRYACNWRNLSMAYDFFRSIGPKKLLYDSEFHGLSSVHWRDPDLTPEYVRCIYWLAHLHGMGMNETWYWGRNADGSPKSQCISEFFGSNLTQPRVMDEFGRTMKELNAFAPEMVALATRPKRVRLFYSEAAAIQEAAYMDHVYETYKTFYHRGFPLGFVTGRMLSEATEQTLSEWTVVVVTQANHVTTAEIAALSRYLSRGGTVVVSGENSLRSDEYGRPHAKGPATGSGRLLRVGDGDNVSAESVVLPLLRAAGALPPVGLKESNSTGGPGCVWRTCPWEDGRLLLVINLGKRKARLEMAGPPTSCRDLLTNAPHPSSFDLAPFGVKLLHVRGTMP